MRSYHATCIDDDVFCFLSPSLSTFSYLQLRTQSHMVARPTSRPVIRVFLFSVPDFAPSVVPFVSRNIVPPEIHFPIEQCSQYRHEITVRPAEMMRAGRFFTDRLAQKCEEEKCFYICMSEGCHPASRVNLTNKFYLNKGPISHGGLFCLLFHFFPTPLYTERFQKKLGNCPNDR